MSHHATSWAIRAGSGCGLTAAAKLVLWQLADRHNPDLGCFPSQDRLAEDCEVSRSQVNVHLANLEKSGLIRRFKQFDPATNQQRPTRYMLAFEKGFEALPTVTLEPAQADLPLEEEPCLETGHGSMSDFEAKPVSDFEAKPCPAHRTQTCNRTCKRTFCVCGRKC